MHRALPFSWTFCVCAALVPGPSAIPQTERTITYRVEEMPGDVVTLHKRFTESQLELLEKLNRADRDHLGQLRTLVVPEQWVTDELAYAVLPERYPSVEPHRKVLVVYLPGQLFGAYESGRLVRWGPVSSGGRASPTPDGVFFLAWKSAGRTSTVDPDWFLRWYFNFGNREGLALHQFALPGQPASHGCIRLLQRDAEWLFNWGNQWVLDATGTRVIAPGTPVFIVGSYDVEAPPPWHSPAWLTQTVVLPSLTLEPGPDDFDARSSSVPAFHALDSGAGLSRFRPEPRPWIRARPRFGFRRA
jgi:hypothetical protein